MAERELVVEEVIARSPGDVFEFVADYRNVADILEGVTRWEPIGPPSRGVGARYRVELSLLGGLSARAIIRLTEWEVPRAIAFETEGAPIRVGGRWAFTPRGEGTLIRLAVAYQPPGGTVGGWLAGAAEVLLRQRIAAAVRTMGQAIEE
jgi:carbon monoxide dehydrogenase subunit G